MFTVIRSSYLYLENFKNIALDPKEERGFRFVCSDKNEFERNTVERDAGLS